MFHGDLFFPIYDGKPYYFPSLHLSGECRPRKVSLPPVLFIGGLLTINTAGIAIRADFHLNPVKAWAFFLKLAFLLSSDSGTIRNLTYTFSISIMYAKSELDWKTFHFS